MRCSVRTRSGLPGCQGKRSLRAPEGSGAWVGGCAYGVPASAGAGRGAPPAHLHDLPGRHVRPSADARQTASATPPNAIPPHALLATRPAAPEGARTGAGSRASAVHASAVSHASAAISCPSNHPAMPRQALVLPVPLDSASLRLLPAFNADDPQTLTPDAAVALWARASQPIL